MKKAIKTALAITCVGSLLTCALAGCTTTKSYKATVEGSGLFANDVSTAMPQTAVHDLVLEHFSSPLPAGKNAKKALLQSVTALPGKGMTRFVLNWESKRWLQI